MIPDGLIALGHEVAIAPVYRTVTADTSTEQLSEALDVGADYITFTSSSTVRNFVLLLGQRPLPTDVKIITIGPVTSETARELGLTVHVEASVHTIDGLIEAILSV